ncbi:HAMP domain-containing sensor histidine kinase [Desulfovibrio sp. Huiquan2017]|uniref:sensor histidine kinase n=1 Tax=Desulfovibrio sp. Huiquan2017 TaxID=2816861 RepID=UPI001A921343|nr:HAMP domain-containing sensor histidine kinase [Desulfovibrio sp. Huiquan2017]
MARVCRRIRQSLFTKLALVLVMGVVAINAVTIHLYTTQKREYDTTLNLSLLQYARHLADQVGSPPDRSRAEALARQRPMRITYTGKASWVVGETEETFPERFLVPRFSQEGIEILNLHENYRLRVPLASGGLLIFDLFSTEAERSALRQFGVYFLVASCLIMLAIYLVLRLLLRPIEWLTEGAESVRDGKLDTRVQTRGSGQLRELCETFNQMAIRLETLVTGQRDLVLGVSHELRTPLTRLKLRFEMLDTEVDTTAIKQDVRQMETMITSLLETAKMHHGADGIRAQSTDMAQLVARVANGYQAQPPGIVLDIPQEPVMAMVDPQKMTIALNTLLDNAIKYSAPDGPSVEVSLRVRGDEVSISITDHGIGIPEESISHLFDPFYRVDESRTRDTGGYGLGLYLCQTIIKAHRAHIEVESTLGVGTTFRVIFQS